MDGASGEWLAETPRLEDPWVVRMAGGAIEETELRLCATHGQRAAAPSAAEVAGPWLGVSGAKFAVGVIAVRDRAARAEALAEELWSAFRATSGGDAASASLGPSAELWVPVSKARQPWGQEW